MEIEAEHESYKRAAAQASLFDKQLVEHEPTPYHLLFRFTDEHGSKHTCASSDWEAHATFWRFSKQYGAARALELMSHTFNDEYPKKGMVFAMGNLQKRPKTWQLLGVIRLDHMIQPELF